MNSTDRFLLAMVVILGLPYLIWRLGRTDAYAPLVVVQILVGILLGPGVLGVAFPQAYATLFGAAVIPALNGLAWWAVILFVWLAGIELDLRAVWRERAECLTTGLLALGTPMLLGALAAAGLLAWHGGWMGTAARPWQFVLGIGMACSVTALPILVLFMEKLDILRQPLGERVLRYAGFDDLAVWGVLALVLVDGQRAGLQLAFLLLFAVAAGLFRRVMRRVPPGDRWPLGLVWLAGCAWAADRAGLHFMVGAFLAGAVTDRTWFEQDRLDQLRQHVLWVLMPVFFLSTGLRTHWGHGGAAVVLAALMLLLAAVGGKLAGVALAGRLLGWARGEAWVIGWLLQTKALIMIIFVNVLLDREVISGASFTALLLMAVASTLLTMPAVAPGLGRRARLQAADG